MMVRFLHCEFIFVNAFRSIASGKWWSLGKCRLNTLRPRRNRRHFSDDIFKCILLNENVLISIKISLEFIPKGPINNIPALVQIMAWRRPGDKSLSEPMMIISLTHICVTQPQWVNSLWPSVATWRHPIWSSLVQTMIMAFRHQPIIWINTELSSVGPSKTNTAKSQIKIDYPDSKVHGANMGPIWGRQDPGGPHVGPMKFAIWV